jgi:ATP adenylyltransferase
VEARPLWAPWRIEYVKAPADDSCPICKAAEATDDAAALVVARRERCFAMLNAFPYAPGHAMVCPYRHVEGLDEIDDAEALEIAHLTRDCVAAMRSAFSADGVNVGINLGRTAGAGVAGHLHQHVVPRWEGDTNFMPVVAGARVMSQALDAAREALASAMG